MEHVGTIISLNGTPSSSEFWFVLNPEKKVEKGQLVEVKTKKGLMIGRISEIIIYNRYYSSPESVSEFVRFGQEIDEHFPTDRWKYLAVKVFPLGVYEDGIQKRVTFPPSPGEKVFLAEDDVIKKFFGFDENGINIGKVEFHDVDVKLNLTRLFQKHLAILAMSGAGKSYLSSVLIEELLDRPKENGSPAVIVIDPHGEYKIFSEDKNYSHKTKVWTKENLKISMCKLSAQFISELLPQLSSQQNRDLSKIIRKLREEKKVYTMDDLIEAIEKSEIKSNTKSALLSWMENLNSSGIFSNVESPTMEEFVKKGQLSIVDLSEFIHLRDKQMIVAYLVRRLFESRRQKTIPPFILIIEEAHQFVPEREEITRAISRPVIEQVAREGRKFCSSLVLISQRPVKLSTTALSQCNTQIILRVTNPYDLDHIQESSEGITRDVVRMIPGLKVGEAFVIGEAVNYPLLMRVRKRKVRSSISSVNFEEELKSWKPVDEESIEFLLS